MTLPEKFKQQLENISISLSPDQEEKLLDYYKILIEENEKINLTAITDFEEVLEKHYLDSLSIAVLDGKDIQAVDGVPRETFSLSEIKNVIDVGSGAGFPGLVLSIIYPQWTVVLSDALRKRVDFLHNTIEKLALSHCSTIHGRAEDLGKAAEHREQYDLCVARAVTSLSPLTEYCLPFVKVGGHFVPYKGKPEEAEVKQGEKAAEELGGRILHSETFLLPKTDYERTLLIIKKESPTPEKYPRRAGVPEKKPL